MKDTCINCGKWKGLHKWDTMQCPFEGDDLFLANQFYAEENAELAALRAERDELRANIEAALFAIEPNRGDMSTNQRQALDNLRAVLAKYEEAQ